MSVMKGLVDWARVVAARRRHNHDGTTVRRRRLIMSESPSGRGSRRAAGLAFEVAVGDLELGVEGF